MLNTYEVANEGAPVEDRINIKFAARNLDLLWAEATRLRRLEDAYASRAAAVRARANLVFAMYDSVKQGVL